MLIAYKLKHKWAFAPPNAYSFACPSNNRHLNKESMHEAKSRKERVNPKMQVRSIQRNAYPFPASSRNGKKDEK